MILKLYFVILFIGALGTSASLAAKPTFDCAKTDSDVEDLICQDNDLAALDHEIAKVYKTALSNIPQSEQATLKATQRGWIKGRNDCWKADDIRDCVQFNYESRITELQIISGQLDAPDPVVFNCADRDEIWAVFYQDSQLPAAVLTRGDDQIIALLSPSGSGSKYEGPNVIFWEKGGTAQVSWNSDELRCAAK